MTPRRYAILAIAAIVASWFRPTLGQFVGVAGMVWFLGTQPIWRGTVLAALIAVVFGRAFNPTTLIAALAGLAPLVADRAIRASGQRFVPTLFLPLAGVAVVWAGGSLGIARFAGTPLLMTFWTLWFASVVNWMWDTERLPPVLVLLAIGTLVWAGAGLPGVPHQPGPHFARAAAAGLSAVAALALAAMAFRERRHRPWALQATTIPLLRSPASGEPLELRSEGGRHFLASRTRDRVPVVDGMPSFLTESDITGLNRKYTHLYDTIAGFYDTAQRVVAALLYGGAAGVHREYLKRLSVQSGDLVLETSVGTGLNLKSLPTDIRMLGADISLGMLRVCRQNLVRWGRKMELFHANAEALPFASEVFDVVFHVGGINFFTDKQKAVLEMIRVAKPGAHLLIADETEKHAQTYGKVPVTGAYFKNRKEPVVPVVDLVPREMIDTHLETVWNGRFYVITFRKPDTMVEK
ncbi:MAG: methyltransferase domain-containing protein [Acidobacteriota bacterium]